MVWVSRKRGGKYYYRTIRHPSGRVERRYCGAGLGAQALAYADMLLREKREQLKKQEQEEQRRHEKVLLAFDEFMDESATLVRAGMVAAGFHRHDRSKWRKRRCQTN